MTRTVDSVDLFRVHDPGECGKDGYPWVWHDLAGDPAKLAASAVRGVGVKDLVREQAGNRCVRCQHPYAMGTGKWSPCDDRCDHGGPYRYQWNHVWEDSGEGPFVRKAGVTARAIKPRIVEARWRILTVHHLRLGRDAKRDLRWWNLCALCQRCHLQIQGKVQMERIWPWPHSEWFRPYAAGWYAHAYLGEDLTREQTMGRLDELLALEAL